MLLDDAFATTELEPTGPGAVTPPPIEDERPLFDNPLLPTIVVVRGDNVLVRGDEKSNKPS